MHGKTGRLTEKFSSFGVNKVNFGSAAGQFFKFWRSKMQSNKAENQKSASEVIIYTPKITSNQPEKILEKAGIRVLSVIACKNGVWPPHSYKTTILAIDRNEEFHIQGSNQGVSHARLLKHVGPGVYNSVNRPGDRDPRKFTLTEIRYAVAIASHNVYNRKVPK